MKLNKIVFVFFFFFCSVFSIMAETMNFTQYYAIETNVKDDKELEKVIEQTHNELKIYWNMSRGKNCQKMYIKMNKK